MSKHLENLLLQVCLGHEATATAVTFTTTATIIATTTTTTNTTASSSSSSSSQFAGGLGHEAFLAGPIARVARDGAELIVGAGPLSFSVGLVGGVRHARQFV